MDNENDKKNRIILYCVILSSDSKYEKGAQDKFDIEFIGTDKLNFLFKKEINGLCDN